MAAHIIRAESTQLRVPVCRLTRQHGPVIYRQLLSTKPVLKAPASKGVAHPYPWPQSWLYDPQLGYHDGTTMGVLRATGRGRAPLSLGQHILLFLWLTIMWFCLPIWYHNYNARAKWRKETNNLTIHVVGPGSDPKEKGLMQVRWDPDASHKEIWQPDESPYKTAYEWRRLMDNPRQEKA